MSTAVESTPIRESSWKPVVIAIVAALGLGSLAVGTVRIAFDDAPATVTSVRAPLWDAQKLEAMEGRQLAEQVAQPVTWDAAKLEAMQGRMLAAQVGTQAPLWDAQKLEAMQGRMLAAGLVGTEDPIVPHVPKRTPRV